MPGSPTSVPPSGDDRVRKIVEAVKDYGIFTLDAHGVVTSWNEGAEHIERYSADEIIGRHFSMFYLPEAVERGWPEHELVVAAAEGRFEEENWRVRKDGSQFWASIVITAVYDANGVLQGFSNFTRDLTERRRQEDALRQSEESFRLLVDGVRDYAIVMLNPQGRVMTWNSGAEQIIGYRGAEIIGRHFSCFYPFEAMERGWPAHGLAVASAQGRFEEEGWRLRRDGTRFWANVVISALRSANGELRGFANLTRDVTDRRRLEELKRSTREMTEFLAMLSHELRNPLAPIRNAVEILELSAVTDPAVVWSREVIGRQVTQLARLVDDLLDVSRITSGKIALSLTLIDLRDVIHHTIEACRASMVARHHRLMLTLPERAICVNGDSTRLIQVMTNLLSNAVKYTPDGGSIGVSLEQHGTDAMVRVTDNGVGMRADLLDRVFELFAQGERTLARSEGGLGVGLTLVRRLVEMHGGVVSASSPGPGQGSAFEMHLPVQTVKDANSARSSTAEEFAHPTLRQRILVVDDNADSMSSMAALLSLKGHDVESAPDGPSALEKLREFNADLVLLDIGLPGLSGYDVAREMRRSGSDVVLCAMTGYGQDEDRTRTRDAGFDHHLTKPVDMTALYTIINDLSKTSAV